MRNFSMILALGACLVATAVGACSSDSGTGGGTPGGNQDASVTDTGTHPASDATDNSCDPLSGTLCAPGSGNTCCLDITMGLSGTCTPVASCKASIAVQCAAPTDCTGGTVCCAAASGSLVNMVLDSGLPDVNVAAIDASAGSIGDLFGPGGINIQTTCKSACGAMEIQTCTKDSDCKNGQPCVELSALAGDASVDAAAAGQYSGLLGGLSMQKACLAADAGLPIPTPDAGKDSGTTTAHDAGADAAADGG